MDNLTHTLVGFIAGESLAHAGSVRETGLPPQVRRGLFVTLAAIGGNLPDLDLVYSYRGWQHSTQGRLDYMLQHRGYTHTVVGCLVLVALLYAAAEWWLARKHLALRRRDRLEIAGVCMLGTLLHLAMDFLNSYGVHPLWPVQNGWVYGDSVFIVEPLYWAAAAPLIFMAVSMWERVIIALALLAAVALSCFSGLVPVGPRVVFLALTLVLLVVGWRAPARTVAFTSAAVMIGVTAAFVSAGRVAAHTVEAVAGSSFPDERAIDHVLMPEPMNPLCWDVLLLETRGDRYIVRRGMVSDWPRLMAPARCPTMMGRPWAESVPAGAPESLRWLGELEMPKALLAKVVAEHCDAAALMQFARVPFVRQAQSGLSISDLRFDRGKGGGMSTIPLGDPRAAPCRPEVPWTPPRLDLLR